MASTITINMSIIGKIRFALSARDLPANVRDPTGLSSIPDPYVKVFYKDEEHTSWSLLGATDHVGNCANPNWIEVFILDWKTKTNQTLRFEIYDYDTLNHDDLIGAVEINVDDYVNDENRNAPRNLGNGGTLNIIQANEIHFKAQVENLPKSDSFGSACDPYVECSWSFGLHGNRHRFHKTKTVDDATNAAFRTICFNNFQQGADQYFHFKVYDEDTGVDDKIGEASFSVDNYVNNNTAATFRLNEGKNNATITISPAPNTE